MLNRAVAEAQINQQHSSLMKTMEENKALENEVTTFEHQMAVDAIHRFV